MSQRFGAICWILAVQFLVVQVVVASQWPTPFSLSTEVISALGDTEESPWHALMNASFMVIGITMSAGALLTRPLFARGWCRSLAVALFRLAGVGVVLVGLYPENENEILHAAGAAANFVGANLALVLYGLAIPAQARRTGLKVFSVMAGLVGLTATWLFVEGIYLGLGIGGMERFAAYTITIWQIVAGLSFLRAAQRA